MFASNEIDKTSIREHKKLKNINENNELDINNVGTVSNITEKQTCNILI